MQKCCTKGTMLSKRLQKVGNLGGDGGIRTPGLHVANVALSQLSYIPTAELKLTGKALSVN